LHSFFLIVLQNVCSGINYEKAIKRGIVAKSIKKVANSYLFDAFCYSQVVNNDAYLNGIDSFCETTLRKPHFLFTTLIV
jgi:hypothetical protein